MKIYRNGDRCPCCGAPIEGKSEEWLELFSSTMYFFGLSEYDGPDPADAEAARAIDRHEAEFAADGTRAFRRCDLCSLVRSDADIICAYTMAIDALEEDLAP